MTINELLNALDMPGEVRDQVLRFDQSFDYAQILHLLDGLCNRDTWDESRARLKTFLREDARGMKMLACMLHCALRTYDEYCRIGIDNQIFTDTMKCFPRFINEHYSMSGVYAFDRDFWTPRQLGMQLFRIGALEYELYYVDGKKVISMHIPSDADICEENCTRSLCQAHAFMERFFVDYQSVDYVCDSWLLSPVLKQLLPETSNILKFQRRFDIRTVQEDAMDFIVWVFKTTDQTLETLPENTSLQRRMKQYLLDGGKVGAAFGVIENKLA